MTTIFRKWNHSSILLGAILLIAASNVANAEEGAVYQQPQTPAVQQAKPAQQVPFDQQYKLPPSYQGKFYPNDDTAIGYHGTTTSAQNQNDSGHNGSYYYYYY